MPTSLPIASFVFGAVLLLLAISGGNIKIFSAEILGQIKGPARWVAAVLGALFIGMALVLLHRDESKPAPSPRPDESEPQPGGNGPPPTERPGESTPTEPPTPAPNHADPNGTQGAKEGSPSQATVAMQWIEARCGSRIELTVPTPPGSTTDRAGRVVLDALGNSGVRPTPVAINVPGVFFAAGRFSMARFDDWYRGRGVKDGCLLVVVPQAAGEGFATPRLDLTLADKTYSVVLPRGIAAEAADRWATVFEKALGDPDFVREAEKSGLKAAVIR